MYQRCRHQSFCCWGKIYIKKIGDGFSFPWFSVSSWMLFRICSEKYLFTGTMGQPEVGRVETCNLRRSSTAPWTLFLPWSTLPASWTPLERSARLFFLFYCILFSERVAVEISDYHVAWWVPVDKILHGGIGNSGNRSFEFVSVHGRLVAYDDNNAIGHWRITANKVVPSLAVRYLALGGWFLRICRYMISPRASEA